MNTSSYLSRAYPAPSFTSRKWCFLALAALAALATVLLAPAAHAQTVNVFTTATTSSAGLEQGLSDSTIIIYRILKFVAVIVGAIGVWRVIEHDYKWAAAAFFTFALLFFMPSIVELAQTMGSHAYATAQQSGG